MTKLRGKLVRTRDLTAVELREILDYNQDTGVFTWRKRQGTKNAGETAGYVKKAQGYVFIRVKSVDYAASRLAWLHVTGEWPKRDIDHKDGQPANNIFSNLRDVSEHANMQNTKLSKVNTTGFRGVSPYRGNPNRYIVTVPCGGGVSIAVGIYDDPEVASFAYRAGRELFGFAPAAEHMHLEPLWKFPHVAAKYNYGDTQSQTQGEQG